MELRHYQDEVACKAAEILHQYGIVYLCLAPRLGKTFTSLTIAERDGAKSVLFVTKKKAISSIMRDYDALKQDNEYIYDITITNPEDIVAKMRRAEKAAVDFLDAYYPSVSRRGAKYKAMLHDECVKRRKEVADYIVPENIDFVIIDEAHQFGTFPKPGVAQRAMRELFHDKKIIFLSGTPSPESWSQLYHQFAISDKSPWNRFKTFYEWAKKYVDVQSKVINGNQVNDYSCAKMDKIRRDVDRYMISMTQKEAGFETEVLEYELKTKLLGTTKNLIRALKKNRVAYHEFEEIVAPTPADLLNKIHQLSGGTVITDNGPVIVDHSKAEHIEQFFRGKHIAIFTCYQAEKTLLEQHFPNWTDDPDEFNADTSKTFICQIRSCREGVNLKSADALVYYNPEYSYLSYEQGKQRAVSKDKTEPCEVWFSISDYGIEAKILECVREKQNFTTSWFMKHI